jgi:methylenetetrahydrofolate dehydrogenase (NADP+)/methenyltetrahydrofolate cyclohydrolase
MKMSQIISGKELSKTIRQDVKEEVTKLNETYGKVPHLVVVLVGEDPASQSYVKAKKRACEKAGMKSTIIRKENTITEDELLNIVEQLNNDKDVHGILVQLPIPKHIDENKVINAIKQEKDVDGFHPLNVAAIHTGEKGILPATPKGIITMLKSTNQDIEGKRALVIGRSNIVGKPVSMLLLKENATVTIAHSRTKNMKELALQSDIIVAAVGRAHFVTADMVKEGAIIIDVGVNRTDEGKLVGDVDFENVKDKVSFITPVPGGVGPMTIASLLQNTVECFVNIEKK